MLQAWKGAWYAWSWAARRLWPPAPAPQTGAPLPKHASAKRAQASKHNKKKAPQHASKQSRKQQGGQRGHHGGAHGSQQQQQPAAVDEETHEALEQQQPQPPMEQQEAVQQSSDLPDPVQTEPRSTGQQQQQQPSTPSPSELAQAAAHAGSPADAAAAPSGRHSPASSLLPEVGTAQRPPGAVEVRVDSEPEDLTGKPDLDEHLLQMLFPGPKPGAGGGRAAPEPAPARISQPVRLSKEPTAVRAAQQQPAPALSDAGAEAQRESECVMCWDAAPETTLAPCGHRSLCLACTRLLLAPRRHGQAATCPVCREEVRMLCSLFGRVCLSEASHAEPLTHTPLQVQSFIRREYPVAA